MKKTKKHTQRKLLDVGDKVRRNSYEFVVAERFVTINPITGLRMVQYTEIPI